MTTIEDIAREYTTMLREGQFAAAGDRYWACDISSIDPVVVGAAPRASVRGKHAASQKCAARFAGTCIDELAIDGPFITGNQFALFVDVVLVDSATGTRRPFSEIALFTVRDGQIAEERFFYA
jgi:hypothetical protein